MTEEEAKVFLAMLRRYLSQYWPRRLASCGLQIDDIANETLVEWIDGVSYGRFVKFLAERGRKIRELNSPTQNTYFDAFLVERAKQIAGARVRRDRRRVLIRAKAGEEITEYIGGLGPDPDAINAEIDAKRIRGELIKLVANDLQLANYIKFSSDNPGAKRAQIASAMGLNPTDVDNMKKRLDTISAELVRLKKARM